MAQRICTVEGCERKHQARGLCHPHYNELHAAGRTHHKMLERACVTCGTVWMTPRADAKYCTEICYHFDKWGPRTCAWPRPTRPVAKPKPEPFREERECAWCGDGFVATQTTMVNCSRECKVRAGKCRRRGREHGSTSHFTWAEFMHLFLTFGRCCAYCEQPITGQPEPDHVVPLSRGGSNSITNLLPSCHACNSDKRNLLLHEWAADRARRGKPTVVTSWAMDDGRAVHLTDALLISPAA